MLWIYNFPNWLAFLVIVGLTVGVALGGHKLWSKAGCPGCSGEESVMTLGMLAVVAMMLSLLLAFSSVSVWEAYTSAESAAATEASVSGELVRDFAVYGGPGANAAREAVREYIQSVIKEDWPAMAKGGASDIAAHKFNKIFHKAALLEPRTPREQILLTEIWSKTNELNVSRRVRKSAAAGSAIPNALWGTLIVGIILNFLLFYVLPVNRLNLIMLGTYAAMLGLMLFFIVVMDRPFAGTVSVSPDAYESALKSMQRWDLEPSALTDPAEGKYKKSTVLDKHL